MVAGEYAVLVPHQPLIVTAVNRFVYVTISKSNKSKLTLENFHLQNIRWKWNHGYLQLAVDDKRTSFVKSAMEVTFAFLQEQSIPIYPVSISVKSELDDQSGVKYGLGSSAAVVTGVVKAILAEFYPEIITKKLIFKLAAIAHVNIQRSGSGADIAASVYGGVLKYASFQADWLLQQMEKGLHITDLTHKKWKYAEIQKLEFPSDWKMSVGWTGEPASTVNLVGKLTSYKSEKPHIFQSFITCSSRSVTKILRGIAEQNSNLFYQGIQQNRGCLAKIGRRAQISIETKLLNELSNIADTLGGAGKLSGAGGGDCGIAFHTSDEMINQIKHQWRKVGIKPLQITIYPHGATSVERK